MFFVRSLAPIYTYIEEVVTTITAYVDAAIVALTTVLESTVSELTTYVDESLAALEVGTKWTQSPDAVATDRAIGDLSVGQVWTDIDFSADVPTGTKVIRVRLEMASTNASAWLKISNKDYSNERSVMYYRLLIASKTHHCEADIWLDANYKCTYYRAGAGWYLLNLQILSYGK